jgi:hypothetical protein
LVKADIYDW